MGLPKPEHPMVSVIDLETIASAPGYGPASVVFDFYSISLKRNCNVKFKYGQQQYDFDEGVMFFIAPGQVFGIEAEKGKTVKKSGWLLLIHPDFLWNTQLAKTIKQYEYFSYLVREALFLSDKEEAMIIGIMQQIDHEYRSNIDKFSQGLIIAQLELLLNYSDRFYHRQFITRKITNHRLLDRMETILAEYFNTGNLLNKGLPTVQLIAGELNVSPNYLSVMLKELTGQSTQQHIHD